MAVEGGPVDLVLLGGGTVYFPHLSNIQSRHIGKGARLHSHIWIGDKVRIGDGVRVQAFAFIPNGVTIHDNVFIGPRVTFTNDRHPPSNEWSETIVEDHVSIGAGAIILPGIRIGAHAVIGAGAVVTHNVPSGATVVGNPARTLREAAE